jgi:hypothetical protein
LNRSTNGKNNIYGFATFRKFSKSNVGIKDRRNYPMEKSKIKREIVAVFMESPFYFSIPLKKRLEFITFFSQQPVYNQICQLNKQLLNVIVA